MMKLMTSLLVVMLMVGCTEGKPNPLIGRWSSPNTGASIYMKKDGECRYYQSSAGGLLCEWEGLGQNKALVVIKRNSIFVEGTAEIIGDSLFFETPSGGLDIFEK